MSIPASHATKEHLHVMNTIRNIGSSIFDQINLGSGTRTKTAYKSFMDPWFICAFYLGIDRNLACVNHAHMVLG